MDIVCIDTQILYWAVVGKATHGAESFVAQASDFMSWLDQQDVRIIIPTIVVGEMLIPIEERDIPETLSRFKEDWIIVEYDIRAALEFARIRRDHIENKRYDDIKKMLPDITKKELVADTMIIATAIAHGAVRIYSHNVGLRHLAEGHIIALSFEDETYQLGLQLKEKEDHE